MTVGVERCQADLFKGSGFVAGRLGEDSIFSVLAREGRRLFPDGMFDDLFSSRGRRSVPPRVVATVMVLQRWFGLSDREAVAAFEFDLRWRYACGGLDVDGGGFSHTVLVGMRARLAASEHPRRIFDAVLGAARCAGALSARRVLDSVPVYDAVAAQDTVTMLHSAIRGLLAAAGGGAGEIAAALGGDYSRGAKAVCGWDDPGARAQLVDSLGADAAAALGALEGRRLRGALGEAAELLAAVAGQDLCRGPDGRFAIARQVAKDRIISTVDPDARHGHKTTARRFDGYKGHTAVDPDSELICATAVTPANTADAQPAPQLINELLTDTAGTGTANAAVVEEFEGRPTVYGDSAYGSAEFQGLLKQNRMNSRCRTQPPAAPGGRFTKDSFDIDLLNGTVTCPAAVTVTIRRRDDGSGTARFATACERCDLRSRCTTAAGGRTIRVAADEAVLAEARARQRDPAWRADYRATRPKVERKLAHLVRRKHGGRHARVRGRTKVDADFNLLAAAANIARLGVLGLRSTPTGWAIG